MALSGELSDLSLAELIEFFCNQRKTGRLKVVYPNGPGYFYLQSGSVVHARIGVLRGIDAVYYALTLPNASFAFSPAFEAPEHSINQPWTSVVLEGLRRMDEGIGPKNPFPEDTTHHDEEVLPLVATVVKSPPLKVEPVNLQVDATSGIEAELSNATAAAEHPEAVKAEPQISPKQDNPLSSTPSEVEFRPFLSQSEGASRFANGPWRLAAVLAAVAVIIGVIAVPWGWYARSKAAKMASEAKLASEAKPATGEGNQPSNSPAATTAVTNPAEAATSPTSTEPATSSSESDTVDAAKRQREARAKEEARAKARATENAGTPSSPYDSTAAKSPSSPGSGAKKVTVTVTYDENGRVTQASGGDPTALRIARQKRFPAGKAGSATITIPIN